MVKLNVLIEIREWVSFSANLCILIITLYTFYLTFISKKVRVLFFGKEYSEKGNSLNIVLHNKSLSPITVTSVKVIVNKKYKFLFKNFENPITINPFTTKYIEMESFCYMESVTTVQDLEDKNIILEIQTPYKILFVGFKNKIFYLSKNIKKMHCNVTVIKESYNNQLIMPGTRYIVNFRYNNIVKNIFIHESGKMTDNIMGYNAIPDTIINNKNDVRNIIKTILEPYNIKFNLEEVKSSYDVKNNILHF